MAISGLSLKKNLLPQDEFEKIVNWLNINRDKFKKISIGNREVIQYGYEYNYKTRKAKKLDDDIPQELLKILEYIKHPKKDLINQLIINKYEKGQRITPHKDSFVFDETIFCFSVGSDGRMLFTKFNDSCKFIAKSNSLYIIEGDARYKWKHEMLPLELLIEN